MTADRCAAGAASRAEEGWHTINWESAYRIVCRLQARIVKAILSRAVRLAPWDAQEFVTLLIDMCNVRLCQPMISHRWFTEATHMPRPLPVPLRQEIVRRHQQGIPLTRISADLAIPYGTVRKVWRLFRRHGLYGLDLRYRGHGRPVPPSSRELLRIACELKREHPAWGAGLIRVRLREHARGARIPSVRSLQIAFVRAGVHRPRRRRERAVVVPWAIHPHEVWQVDAVENVPLATPGRISWLTVTDEASGAILAAEVSPHRRWEHVPAPEIREMFRRVFARRGLPDRVRVDNGYPWGIPRDLPSELALWLIGLGVEPIWIPPARPTCNPKVERSNGVTQQWGELHTCAGCNQAARALDWVCRVQREEYPAARGRTRAAAFPQLATPRRAYRRAREASLWDLARVDDSLARGAGGGMPTTTG
jgi:hypothetical protein